MRALTDRVLPIVTRVEKGVEGWSDAKAFYRSHLDKLIGLDVLPSTQRCVLGHAEIVHYPNYALGERLAVLEELPSDQRSLLLDMRRLVSRMVENEFMSVSEPFPAPKFSQEFTKRYRRRIRFSDPRLAELDAVLEREPRHSLSLALLEWAGEARRTSEYEPEWLEPLSKGFIELAASLRAAGDRTNALKAILEAVEILRRLAEVGEGRSLRDLASSLRDLGGNSIQSRPASREGCGLFPRGCRNRTQSAKFTGRFRPFATRDELEASRPRARRPGAARGSTRCFNRSSVDSKAAGWRASGADPGASDLHELGSVLFYLGRYDESATVLAEAIDIRTKQTGALASEDLAKSYTLFGEVESRLGHADTHQVIPKRPNTQTTCRNAVGRACDEPDTLSYQLTYTASWKRRSYILKRPGKSDVEWRRRVGTRSNFVRQKRRGHIYQLH